MKDILKDTIMICKGYYNQELHINTLAALRAYQSRECGVKIEYLTPDDILSFTLFPTAEKYFETKHWMEMIKDRMYKHDILFQQLFNKDPVKFEMEYMCNLLIRQICSLQVLDIKNDNVIIDLSDYDKDENII